MPVKTDSADNDLNYKRLLSETPEYQRPPPTYVYRAVRLQLLSRITGGLGPATTLGYSHGRIKTNRARINDKDINAYKVVPRLVSMYF